MNVIGLAGFARSGKDSFATSLTRNHNFFKTESFAYEMKKQLDPFLKEQLGISAFTENDEEKAIIRPILICWGTEVIRNKVDKEFWIKKIIKKTLENQKQNLITIITDVRFINEANFVKKHGCLIFIERENCKAVGVAEKETPDLKQMSDFVFKWPILKNFKKEHHECVTEFYNKSLKCRMK